MLGHTLGHPERWRGTYLAVCGCGLTIHGRRLWKMWEQHTRHLDAVGVPAPVRQAAAMSVVLWLLAVCALIVLAPMALATLLLTCSLIWTAIGDARSRGRMRHSLDELLRERR